MLFYEIVSLIFNTSHKAARMFYRPCNQRFPALKHQKLTRLLA